MSELVTFWTGVMFYEHTVATTIQGYSENKFADFILSFLFSLSVRLSF